MAPDHEHDRQHEHGEVSIAIDTKPYIVRGGPTPVAHLRALVTPPMPAEDVLWHDILDAQDEPLDPAGTITVVDGMRFFTEIETITIRIDRVVYEVTARKMTGTELRALPSPDVPADRDLWRDVPDKRDVKVQDEDVVRLHDGTRFFTAPGRINPGAR